MNYFVKNADVIARKFIILSLDPPLRLLQSLPTTKTLKPPLLQLKNANVYASKSEYGGCSVMKKQKLLLKRRSALKQLLLIDLNQLLSLAVRFLLQLVET
jgi:hypothetical protein